MKNDNDIFIINVFSKANLKLRFKTESLCLVNVTCLLRSLRSMAVLSGALPSCPISSRFLCPRPVRLYLTLRAQPKLPCYAGPCGATILMKKKKKRMAKLNKTMKVPYSGFEWFRAGSSQSIKIGTHLSIDKLIKIGKSNQFIDIDCIDQSVEIDDTLISFMDLSKFYRFHRYIPEDTSALLFIQKWKLISCEPLNLLTIELELRVEGSNNLLSL